MFDTVVLAAGSASRMGMQKLLLPYLGIPLICRALDQALAASRHVVLVLGHDAAAVRTAALGTKGIPSNLSIAINPNPQRGQFSSTQTGVAHILGDLPFAITVADVPLVTVEHYKRLEAILEEYDAVRPLHNGTPGHPVLCAPYLRSCILSQGFDTSMNAILQERCVRWLEDGDAAWTTDVDTPQAYSHLIGLFQETEKPH